MIQRTLSIIKPDATARSLDGAILKMIQEAGLKVVAMKRLHLTAEQAGGFYAVHKERPFYNDLCSFMSSGPVLVSVLEGEDAIARYRTLMGATNPEKAEEGTIRKAYAQNIEANSVHGSDAPETAAFEISYFFSQLEIVG
ncbi:Nucleoside diphosphate kinase [Desulfovibrio sp. X2]|uniref:nucleoside-diphosphate kinase n=1 Tax=Desulfovibrio sp. X2 TaxID=941449 RepID=UPI000358AF97|nr:nucleoside-diphosphate kinase [Desulfovibrio sp. X2]EPR42394.1 Nucleoside diphosphate kinase [Desulfovibrio sp. X2]